MQSQCIKKELKCQNGCLVLIRFVFLNIVAIQQMVSFIPAKQMLAVIVYMTGLITCNESSATAISASVGFVSHDMITRMLIAQWWSQELLMKAVVSLVSLLGEGWLILDDTLIPKVYAKLIAFCNWDWDHSEKRNKFGIRLVVIVWSNGHIVIPIGFYIWQKEAKERKKNTKKPKNGKKGKQGRKKKRGKKIQLHTREAKERRAQYRDKKNAEKKQPKLNVSQGRYFTKNELACELVGRAVATGIVVKFILFDNWYASQKNLEFFSKDLHLDWVTRIKHNQKVIYQGKKLSVREVGDSVKKSNYHYYACLKGKVRSFEILLHGRPVKLTVIKDDPHPERDRTKYLITSNLHLSNIEHVSWYRKRWAIEVFFKETKSLLGLGESQVRRKQAVLTHIVLVFMAYIVLQLFKPLPGKNKVVSVNQSKNALKSLKLLVFPELSLQQMVSLKSQGAFELSDIDQLIAPVRTRLLEGSIPKHIVFPMQI